MSTLWTTQRILRSAILLSIVSAQTDDTEDDICAGLPQQECQRKYEMTTGDTLCAYNIVMAECYPITRTQGEHGNGNFDDGFLYAKSEADGMSEESRIILVVFGILSGLLLVTLVLGVWYIWNLAPSLKRHISDGTESTEESDPENPEKDDFISRTKSSLHVVDAKYSITATPIEVSGLTLHSEGRVRHTLSEVEDPVIARWRAHDLR